MKGGERMLKKSNVLIALVVALVAVTSVSAPAAFANTTKPGWGYGDNKHDHDHLGPPGQSVRPSIVDRLKDRENNIVNRLGNSNLPEPQKTDFINEIESAFDHFISLFG
jgi:hypothetical protein